MSDVHWRRIGPCCLVHDPVFRHGCHRARFLNHRMLSIRLRRVVGQRRFFTTWEDRPDTDALDKRKVGPW